MNHTVFEARLRPSIGRQWLSVLAMGLTAAACSDGAPTAVSPSSVGASFLISDGAHAGNRHFFFLSPIANESTPAGTFDGDLEPTVEVCVLDVDGGCLVPIATFNTFTGPDSETIRVDSDGEYYLVNWHTGDFPLDPLSHYRIRVLVGIQQLGFADVDVLPAGQGLRNAITGDVFGLVDGRTLPIKFRIEDGAVGRPDRVATGSSHTCVLDAEGAAYCAGLNSLGQIGNGTISRDATTPTAVVGGHAFSSIHLGGTHTCGVTLSGDAYCWGSNQNGQLGTGTVTLEPPFAVPTPVLVAGGRKWRELAAGGIHTCGLTVDGEVYCWGQNSIGQLGRGSPSPFASPDPAPIAGGEVFQAVRSSGLHTCAVTVDGRARCWGWNFYGQIGNGTSASSFPAYAISNPTPVSGGHIFAEVDAGQLHTCGTTVQGTALCWGYNEFGGVGNGVFTPPNVPPSGVTAPTPVSAALVFKTVRAGVRHSCGISIAGDTFCWGYNEWGALGIGVFSKSAPFGVATPTPVTGEHAFVAIDLGSHTCATTDESDVYCWGFNAYGGLGNGTINVAPDWGVPTPTLSLFDLGADTP